MGRLTRAAILAANDLKTEAVLVPEWRDEDGNEEVVVKRLRGYELEAWHLLLAKQKDESGDFASSLVALTVVDADGALLFTPADIKALAQKSGAALDRVFQVAKRLNKIGEQGVVVAKGESEPGRS